MQQSSWIGSEHTTSGNFWYLSSCRSKVAGIKSCISDASATHQQHSATQLTPCFQADIYVAAERLVKGPSGLGKGLPLPIPKGSSQSASPAKEIAEVCTRMVKVLHARDDCRICLRERSGVDRLCALLTKVCLAGCCSAGRQLTTHYACAVSIMRYNQMSQHCVSSLLPCCMRPTVSNLSMAVSSHVMHTEALAC